MAKITNGIILPFYENPGTHDPSSNNYVSTKSVLPSNHEALFNQSVVGADGNRWTKVGTGKKAVYHRFFESGVGSNKWHWSGSSNGKTKSEKQEIIKENEIPVGIKRL